MENCSSCSVYEHCIDPAGNGYFDASFSQTDPIDFGSILSKAFSLSRNMAITISFLLGNWEIFCTRLNSAKSVDLPVDLIIILMVIQRRCA